jgi:hypothetical protein
MNRADALCVLTTLDRFRPGYAEWRSEQAHKLAGIHGTKAADESRAMVDSIARTLADVATDEAADVISEMEAGKVPVPFWGEMASSIRGAALESRRGRREAERFQRDREERFRCLDCCDRGSVVIYNPDFLEWIRPQFADLDLGGPIPLRWYRQLVAAWNHQAVGVITDGGRGFAACAAEIPLVCQCGCDAAVIFRRQINRMQDSLRDAKAKPLRAAYAGQWDPEKHCRQTDDPHADMTEWFEQHSAADRYQWNP